ncbi:MAG: gliding motility-associated C-terminal domain-containing protein, partial [Bacteroidales bacterium]|nr:gliding motility-associated C-terminal domain-containing protein [Bacteroidales bacterium]
FLDVDCDETVDILRWTIPENDDIDGYYIYYQKTYDSDFQLLDSLLGNPYDTVYTFYNDNKLAGCYYVTAMDVNGNFSDESNIVCAYGNECPNYILPNVFTPNGDGYNDLFVPKTYSSVEKVEMSIYNRQGRLVFETSDPEIKWDGKDILTGNDVSVGVYFYVCVVYSYSYDGDYQTVLRGVIHVMR